MTKKKILIFIITYKASHRLKKVFEQIPFKKLNKYKISILISDDKSGDDTFCYAKKIKKNNKNIFINLNNKNLGYGAHVKKCLKFALKKKFDYAIMIHGDGQYHPKYISNILNKFNEDQDLGAVTGSRILKGIYQVKKGGMPIYKLLGNIILTKIHNFFLNTNFTDAHSGLWGYNLNYLKNKKFLKLTDTFNFDQHIRFYYIINQIKITEIPIKTHYGDERSQLHIIYAIKFLLETLFFSFKKELFKI